jgi:hypothetical protein
MSAAYDSDTDALVKCGNTECPCANDDRYIDRTPKTLVEQLDSAKTGAEFGGALLGFMAAVDRERYAEEEGE